MSWSAKPVSHMTVPACAAQGAMPHGASFVGLA